MSATEPCGTTTNHDPHDYSLDRHDYHCDGVNDQPATSGPLMDIKEFTDLGFLQEVNRLVLHPAGLALAVQEFSPGRWHFVGVYDWRDDPEGVLYGPGELDSVKRHSVRAEWERHGEARIKALRGDFLREAEAVIQPIR